MLKEKLEKISGSSFDEVEGKYVLNELVMSLSKFIDTELEVYEYRIYIDEGCVACELGSLNRALGAADIKFKGTLSISSANKNLCIDANLFLFSSGFRVAADRKVGDYLSISYDKSIDEWCEPKWLVDEYGEYESFERLEDFG